VPSAFERLHRPTSGNSSPAKAPPLLRAQPASVMHFTREANFTEDYILFIDADMILTRPIDPVKLGAKKGTVVSEHVAYMLGSSNQMAKNFLPPENVRAAPDRPSQPHKREATRPGKTAEPHASRARGVWRLCRCRLRSRSGGTTSSTATT
jgi:hypothetical protein